MPATKRTGLIAINLRLPKGLHRSLKQRAKRNGIPLNTEIINQLEGYEARLEGLASIRADEAAERTKAAVKQVLDDYLVPLSEIGFWTSEYARTRWEGGHPALPPGVVSDLIRRSQEAGVTPTEYFRRLLQERGIDPDAPYEPPAAEQGEQDEK